MIMSVESVEVEEEEGEGTDVVMSMIPTLLLRRSTMSMDDSNDVGSMMLVLSEMSMSMMAMGDGGASMPPGTLSMSIETSEMSVASMILDDARPVDVISMSMSMPEDTSVSIIQQSEMDIDMSMGGNPEPGRLAHPGGAQLLFTPSARW